MIHIRMKRILSEIERDFHTSLLDICFMDNTIKNIGTSE